MTMKGNNTLREFGGELHKFKVERVGVVRLVVNIEHLEMAFLPATRRGFELWYLGSRFFRHEDLPGD